jgi:sortase A
VLFGLVLLLEVLIAVSAAVTWMWRRWGKWQTWIVGLPVLAALAIVTSNSLNQWLLPNLL